MAESKNLREEESRLPVVVSPSKTLSTRAASAAVSRRSVMTAALASLAPLAIEIIYGLSKNGSPTLHAVEQQAGFQREWGP